MSSHYPFPPPLVLGDHSLPPLSMGVSQKWNHTIWFCQVALVVKDPPANAGDISKVGLIAGLGRSSGEGNGNLLQYSYLENPMDRGTWWASL